MRANETDAQRLVLTLPHAHYWSGLAHHTPFCDFKMAFCVRMQEKIREHLRPDEKGTATESAAAAGHSNDSANVPDGPYQTRSKLPKKTRKFKTRGFCRIWWATSKSLWRRKLELTAEQLPSFSSCSTAFLPCICRISDQTADTSLPRTVLPQ